MDRDELTYSDLPLELQREIVGFQYALRAAVEELAEVTGKTADEHRHWLNEAAIAVAASLPAQEVEKIMTAMLAFREQSRQGTTTARLGDRITGLGWVGHDQQPVIATGSSRIPNYYNPPIGTPLRWQDDQTGQLEAAVVAYFDRHPTEAQIELVKDWLRYYANAPCWQDPNGAIAELVREAPLIRSMAGIDQWLEKAMHEGIDPF